MSMCTIKLNILIKYCVCILAKAKSLKVLYGTLLKALMPTEIPAAEPKGMDMHKGYNSINGLVVAWFLLCNNPGSYYNPPPFAYGFMHSFL